VTGLRVILTEHWYPKKRNDMDLARALSVSHSAVSRWISGEREPSDYMKIRIGEVLGKDSRIIFPDIKKQRTP